VDPGDFSFGTRVERTGIALVHEGEYIVPAPGSEAMLAMEGGEAGGAVINYYFPVEIEIAGTLDDEQVATIAGQIFDALEAEMASRR
jgi:hypothetical protein